MRPSCMAAVLWVSLFAWLQGPALPISAQEGAALQRDEAADAEEAKLKLAAERFLGVLEKNPRRGTALDRLYGYHIEAGSIEKFLKEFHDRAAKNPADGAAWMIVGLIESQRGKDAAAVEAFRQAETRRADDPLASYYLGQSLVLVGQPEEAAAAFERAIARKPQRADLLEIFQALGRVYQRAQKGDQALAVWGRLEKLFPGDLRVQEQIATTLVEEGQPEQALPRFEALIKAVKDDYRVATFKVEAADIKVRLGKSKEALADFEGLLANLNPDNWLFRDVRRRIEDVFLRGDDQAGLATYYESWIERNKEDVDSMARLARVLGNLGRTPESQSWLDKALKLAPSRKDLRLVLIEQLLVDRRFADAAQQYELLVKNDPNNPDFLREWGRLILKDQARAEPERKAAAAAVWRKLLDARPKDSLTATQVADLFRQTEMVDEALELYKKAIELSPEAAQYREYLGEYYHTLKRKDEALATWREIATEKKRTPVNLARLAEVLAGFGYIEEAVENILAAAKLDDDEFKYPLQAAEFLSRAEKYDEALAQLDLARKLASGPEEIESVLNQRIRNLQLADLLEEHIDKLQKDLESGVETTAERWYMLARYEESARLLPEAAQSLSKALSLDERSIPYRTVQARIQESGGNLQEAADTYRRLATLDRRFRTQHLMAVAKLEAQLGRADQALQAGRELLAAAPGNAENYEFYAQLCFQLGKSDDGLDALRRSARLNSTDSKPTLTLAQALAEQFRTDEAIELYWRAFDKATDVDGKVAIVPRLTDLYLQTNHFDRLIERFERERREPNQQREMTICLAQAYQSAGDYGTARQELERLLSQNSRDTQLLQQLSTLSENEGDLAAAVKYQQQTNAAAPGREGEQRLATLLMRSGDTEEASAIWARLTAEESDPARLLGSVDGLLAYDRRDTALSIIERITRDQPRNWEFLYRYGVALASDKPDEAKTKFEAILAVNLPNDEQGAQAKARAKMFQNRPAAQTTVNRSGFAMTSNPLQDLQQAAYQVRSVAGFDGERGGIVMSASRMQSMWGPADFGQGRMAAIGWLLRLSERAGAQEEFVRRMKQATEKPDPDARELWDWYFLQAVRQDQKEIVAAAARLARTGDVQALALYLVQLSNRAGAQRRTTNQQTDTTPPLAADEIDFILASYRSIQKKRPELLHSSYGQTIATNVLAELKRAQRTDDESQVYREIIASAERPENRALALQQATSHGDFDLALQMFDKLAEGQLAKAAGSVASRPQNVALASDAVMQLMSSRSEAGHPADVTKVLDRYLDYVQRAKSALSSGRPVRRATNPAMRSASLRYYVGGVMRGARVDFPPVNDYFDANSLNVLQQAFQTYRKDDLSSDLVAHARQQAESAPEVQRVWWRLALAYLLWWGDDQEQSVAEITRATELVPADQNLKLELAAVHERRQDFESALKVVESVAPLDHTLMQQRETSALRLAVRTGDVDRARLAAERLFGLRLDAETQVQLAAEMRPLGMHEHAEAVLARARRQAGNRTAALVNLMVQYQAQQKPDLAIQVAHQLLRRGTPGNLAMARVRGYTEDDSARQQALSVLGRSGKLKELIERAEAQIKTSPNSIQLYQTLSEYYQAAGDRTKSLEMLDRQVKIRPDDAKLRFQIAQQLTGNGKPLDALEHYKVALKKEPQLFSQSSYEVQNAFRQANKMDDLIALIDQMDLKAMGQYYYVMNIAQELVQTEQTRAAGLKLFKRSWDAFPDNRQYLLQYMNGEQVWQMPEILEYARQAIIPGETLALADPWGGHQSMTYMGDGRVSAMTTMMIDAATKQNRLPALKQDIEAGLKRQPGWHGGKILMAVIHAKSGKPDLARPIIEEMLADKKNPIPPQTCWIVAQELENFDATRPLARALHESVLSNPDYTATDYSYSPLRRLVAIYQKSGETAKARELLMKAARARSDQDQFDPAYAAYRRMGTVTAVGTALVEMGDAVEAVRLFAEILDNEEMVQQVKQFGGDYYEQQARQGYDRALKSLTTQSPASALRTLLEVAASTEPRSNQPAVDLVVLVQPRELDRATLISTPAQVLRTGTASPELKTQAKSRLAELLKAHPDDLAVQVLATTWAFGEGEAPAIAEAVARLSAAVERTPLEELPPGGRANSRQRTEAAHQIGLWIAARECLAKPEHREAGTKLAARALEAARRQTDRKFALALLREWGQILLDQGDRPAAQARWTEMLKLVLPPPAKPKAAAPPAGAPAGAPAPLPAARPAAAAPAFSRESDAIARVEIEALDDAAPSGCGGDDAPTSDGPSRELAQAAAAPAPLRSARAGPPTAQAAGAPPTLEQLNQALSVARMAAENGLSDLSLLTIQEAFKAGPPLAGAGVGGALGRSTFTTGGMVPAAFAPILQQVADKVIGMSGEWNRAKIPIADQYATLAAVVFPEGRPAEIFLYPRALSPAELQGPLSVGRALAASAVRAGRLDDLRKRVAARATQPLAQTPGQVLLALAALEQGDAAGIRTALAGLLERLKTDPVQNSAELACHVALPALERDDIAAAALPVVEMTVERLAIGNPAAEPVLSLLRKLARTHLRLKNEEAARRTLAKYMEVMQVSNSRYAGSGDVALEFARGGMLADALEMLAQAAETATSQVGDRVGPSLAMTERLLARLPAAERYEILRKWTLPTDTRPAVRMLSAFVIRDRSPAVFGSLASVAARPAASTSSSKPQLAPAVDMTELLIDAAREMGQLDALAADLKEPVAKNLDKAKTLALMVDIARGAPEAGVALEREIAEYNGRFGLAKDGLTAQQPQSLEWTDYRLARAAIASSKYHALGESYVARLFQHANQMLSPPWVGALRHERAAAFASRVPDDGFEPGQQPDLALWHPVAHVTAAGRWDYPHGVWWVAHDGHVARASTPQDDCLYFDYPLTGEFDFEFEGTMRSWDEANFSYGGLIIEPLIGGVARNSARIFAAGRHDVIQISNPMGREAGFQKLTLQVRSGRIRALVSNHLWYETEASPCNPWLALLSSQARGSVFRNLKFRDSPQIPREVPLVQGDRLDGWISSYYGETQPRRLTPVANAPAGRRAMDPENLSWQAREGVIQGRPFTEARISTLQSRLYYHRPLRPGETVRYEFLYAPGGMSVFPALDRLAFVLDPAGVRLHWMTDAPIDPWSGLADDNLADEPQFRRGPKALPLKPGDWNAVRLSLAGGNVVLALNGETIYERPLEADNDRLFGFYHRLGETAEIRNVVLSGDWPERLTPEQMNDPLAAPAGPKPSAAALAARHAIVDEIYLILDWQNVQERARKLPPVERYALLRDWVLPGPMHPTIRVYGGGTPFNQPPVDADAQPTGGDSKGARVGSGGELTGPVQDLIELARDRNTLDDLRTRALAFEPQDDYDRRSRLAFLTLVALAAKNEQEAAGYLRELRPLLDKPIVAVWQHLRWPELVAAWEAASSPTLRPAALELFDVMLERTKTEASLAPALADLERRQRALRDQARYLTLVDAGASPLRSEPALKQWTRVTHGGARSHGHGYPLPQWHVAGREVRHYGGHEDDYLYFRVPLRGDFTVDCQLSLLNWTESHLAYGATWVGVEPGHKAYRIANSGRQVPGGAIDPPLPQINGWYFYRLVVQGETATSFVNGIKLHEQPLPAEPDPWLAIHSNGQLFGGCRNLRITGNPTVPASISLSRPADLAGWRLYFPSDTVTGDNVAWTQAGGELVGNRTAGLPSGLRRQSLLRYHRPLLEDGTIEYEFLHQAGESVGTPVLDRLAFLLEPAGVRIHWVTDAQFDRTGLPHDNVFDEPRHRRGPVQLPLKERDWNRVVLKLVGDVVSLTLNDQLIYERPLEPTNQRTFGFFHYADETELRVRNVNYRGDWPKVVPPVEQQELAPPQGTASRDGDRSPRTRPAAREPGTAPRRATALRSLSAADPVREKNSLEHLLATWSAAVGLRPARDAAFPVGGSRTLAQAPAPAPAASGAFVPAAGGSAGAPPSRSAGSQPATISQFLQAGEISQLAAEHGMHELAMLSIREALKAGPPVTAQSGSQFGNTAQMRVIRSSRTGTDESSILQQVADKLSSLLGVWTRHQIPVEDQYELLASIVLPEGRPAEIFLYARPLASSDLRAPQSVARLLALTAVKARRADDLVRRVESRQNQPLAQLPARVLAALVALESGDEPLTQTSLAALHKHLQTDTSQNSAELAGHVALVALDRRAFVAAALPILDVTAERLAAAQAQNDDPTSNLMMKLARVNLQQKNAELAEKFFRKYLDSAQQMNVRYSGDYGLVRRKTQLGQVAQEFAQAGFLAQALDFVGQANDIAVSTTQYGTSSSGPAIAAIAFLLEQLPPAESYELLKTWTLPTAERQAVRLAGDFTVVDRSPASLRKLATWNQRPDAPALQPLVKPAPAPSHAMGSFLSTADLLIDAARAVGRLEELSKAADEAADKKLDKAEPLALLVAIADGRGASVAERIEARLKDYNDRFKSLPPNNRGPQIDWVDYVLARACAREGALRPRGERYLRVLWDHAKRGSNATAWPGVLPNDLAAAIFDRLPESTRQNDPDPGLDLWYSGAPRSTYVGVPGIVPWWTASENHVKHLGGPGDDFLYFKYPLEGTFEFSVEGSMRDWDEANVSYAGLVFEVLGGVTPTYIYPIGRHEVLTRPDPLPGRAHFHPMTLEISPGRIRCLVADHLVYENTDPSPISPWLALFGGHPRHSVFRNPKLTGDFRIPREVRLSSGDRLEGWLSMYGTLPPRLSIGENVQRGRGGEQKVTRDPNPDAYAWRAEEGVIIGRSGGPIGQTVQGQARLYYHRPLRRGEVIRYEFLYEPGKTEVHPALERLTFLLDPAGVRLHWMTDGTEIDQWNGLSIENVADEPEHRRGPAPLPLKSGEWNAVRLSLVGDIAVLELNGVEIHRRPIEPTNVRTFGLFYDPRKTGAKVRNVVLSGDWPEKLTPEQVARLFAPARDDAPPATRHARHAAIEEVYFASNWETILEESRQLPPLERYAALRAWVLPGADHPTVRLMGGGSPVNQPPVDGRLVPPKGTARRVNTGGELTSPAFDLIETARGLGKLDELAGLASAIEPVDDFARRGKLALLTLISVSQGNEGAAAGFLKQLRPFLDGEPAENYEYLRWPELVAAYQASGSAQLRPAALELLDAMVAQNDKLAAQGDWEAQLKPARDRARYLASEEAMRIPFGSDPVSKQWSRVTQGHARMLARGNPQPHWRIADREAWHYSGHQNDALYFNIPLRGDFEIRCQLKPRTQLQYAGMRLTIGEKRKAFTVWNMNRRAFEGTIEADLPEPGEWSDFRFVVKADACTTWIDGVKIHEQGLPAEADPWLAICCDTYALGGCRNLEILGQPIVPAEIVMSQSPNLAGWRVLFPNEKIAGDIATTNQASETFDWNQLGEELVGRKVPDIAPQKLESLLRFHRPMLEDGTIDYEFYLESGKTRVDPALDRLTFLLEPQGVRIHWITDGANNRTALPHDNVVEEPGHRRGPATLPLKDRDWNKVSLAIKGDVVSLMLNGELVYERPLEVTNQRTFGLFHYSDETDVRVRNMIHRGDWPRLLPSLADQELAPPRAAATAAK